jgi:hypothetical protein
VESKTNWQAVSALAAIASALIAFLTFASHTQGSASPTTPPSASSDPSTSQAPAGNALPSIAVALSSLPDPCDAPVAATISPFRTVAAQPDDTSNQDGKGCHWFENGTYNTFDILYSTVGFQLETGSSPISVPGLPHAVKDRWGSSNGCQIEWQASFGTIFVTASAGAGPHDNDPIDQCVNTESWIMLVLPSLPK